MNLLLLLILGTIWGSSYLFIKVAVAEVPVITLIAGRLLLATIILWILLWVLGQSMQRSRSLWRAYAVMGILSGTLPYTLIAWGEQYIPSSLAALLQATMPIFTIILAILLAGDEPMTWTRVLGVIVGFVGVGILMAPDVHQGLQASLLGQLAVVLASASYAGAAVFARKQLRGQPPLASTTGQMTMGAIFTLPLSLLIDRPFDLSPSLPVMASWLALTVLGTAVADIIYYALIKRTSATFVSTVTYIIPIIGLVLGALVLGEPLTLVLAGSSILILLGVVLVRPGPIARQEQH